MEADRADSGISIDYFDPYNLIQDPNHLFSYYDNCFQSQSAIYESSIKSTTLIKLINYINPRDRVSDREVIISIIEYLLGTDNGIFDLFKSTKSTLNNLTLNCSMDIMNKFEEFGLKLHNLTNFIDSQLNDEDDNLQVSNSTLYTYSITLRKIINQHVHRVILRIVQEIKMETTDFKSLWHFHQYLNSHQCNYLVEKVCLLNSINLNVNDQQVERKKKLLDNYHQLVTILDQLYLNLKFPNNENRYLWVLFLNCLKPSLKYLQDFLINGYSSDTSNEFFFENVDYQYESDFWSTCLVMRDRHRIPICLRKCWTKLINGLKSRLLMRYADEKFEFRSFSLYKEFIDDLFLNLGFHKKSNDERSNKSPEPLTSNAFSCDYLNKINNEVSKLFSSVESIDRTSIHTFSSSLESGLNDDINDELNNELEYDETNQDKFDLNNNLEIKVREHIKQMQRQIDSHENINLDLIEFKRQFDLEELNLDEQDNHEFDDYIIDNRNRFKQINIYFDDSLERSFDKIIEPISRQVSELLKKDYLNCLHFFNDYYLMQLEQHSFSLFFDTLFEKLVYDPIGFQDNLYSKVYDLRDFGFENTNLIIFLKFSETFDDDLIYFDIISRLNLLYKDLDWTSSTIINNDAQDFYNRSCKVLMKIKFIKWLTNNLPILNRDFNQQRQRKLPFYNLFHKLFLIKHNLSILLDTLNSSILIKINSLQFDLYERTKEAKGYEELANIFQHFLNQVGSILHLNVFVSNENDESNPFHTFIRRLCVNAIDIWKCWFSIEQLFYSNFDECNTHKQLAKYLNRIDEHPIKPGSSKLKENNINKQKTKLNGKVDTKVVDNLTMRKAIKETNLPKAVTKKKSSLEIKNQFKQVENTLKSHERRPVKCPDHFDKLVDLAEINRKLDDINKFLRMNAEIFQI